MIKNGLRKLLNIMTDLHLQTKLIMLNLVAVIVPVSLVLLLTFSVYISSLEKQLIDSEYRSLSQISISFERYLNELSSIIQRFSTESSLNDVLRTGSFQKSSIQIKNNNIITNEMKNTMVSHQEILGFYLFCENGYQYKLHRNNSSIVSYMDQAWYIAAKQAPNENMLFADNMLNDHIDFDRHILTFQRGISDHITDEFLGVAVFLIDASYFDTLLSSSDNIQPSALMITDSSGRIIYHTDKTNINKLIINHDFMTNIIPADRGYYEHNSSDSPSVAIFSSTSDLMRYKVIELLPLDIFYSSIRQTQMISVLIYVLSVGTLLIFITILSSKVTHPLRRLAERLESYRNPNSNIALPRYANNEIESLNISFSNMIFRINDLINNVYRSQIKQKESELNALQSKINPHFLYNTLEMISALADNNHPKKVKLATRSLGKLLQYSLRFENESVTFREEMANIKHYIDIQQMRFGDRFKIITDISPSALNFKIIKLVIQPLIENSIYHGLEPKIGCGTILISGNVNEEGDLEIIIKDNGVGISEEDKEILNSSFESGKNMFPNDITRNDANISRGFALMNVHSRLLLSYGEGSGLKIDSKKNQGTEVTLTIKAAHAHEAS